MKHRIQPLGFLDPGRCRETFPVPLRVPGRGAGDRRCGRGGRKPRFFQHFWGFSMGFLGGWWWLEPWNLDWLSRKSWEWNGIIIPTDEVILFRGVAQPPTSINGSLNGGFKQGKSSINRDCSANHVQWGFLIGVGFHQEFENLDFFAVKEEWRYKPTTVIQQGFLHRI